MKTIHRPRQPSAPRTIHLRGYSYESNRGNETDQGSSSLLNEIHRTRQNEIKEERPD